MIQVPRGPGGWANKFAVVGRVCALGLALAALGVAGCSSSHKQATPGAGTGGSSLGESGIGGQGSLGQFQKGTLGQGSEGPLSDIHFDYNDFTVRTGDGDVLRTNANWLTQHPGTRVQVEGHCDERGSEEYNIALGAKRAQAAKDYLTTLGVTGDRISTISYGKELPVCQEHNDGCWARNRRDHFVVSQ